MLEIGGNDFNYAFLQLQQTRPADGGYGLGNVTRIVETLEQAGALVPPVVQSISSAAHVSSSKCWHIFHQLSCTNHLIIT